MNKKILAIGIILFILFSPIFTEEVKAAEQNMSGWAWSSTIGWISFNNSTSGATIDYGVHIGTDGVLVGWAWSSNIGWIQFDSTLAGPEAPTYSARVDRDGTLSGCGGVSGRICGWARALAHGDGWDGWILLGPIATSPENGVRLVQEGAGSVVRGYTWGDDVVGWVSFNCLDGGNCVQSNYRVTTTFVLNRPPVVTNSTSTINYCSHHLLPRVATGTALTLGWTYFDADGNTQSQYEVQIRRDNNNFADTPNNFTVTVTSSSHSFTVNRETNPSFWDPPRPFFNTTFHWRVRAHDGNLWSEWVAASFLTQPHPSPLAIFSHLPERISINEVVTFRAQNREGTILSQTYDGSTPHFAWTFDGGSPSSVTSTSTATTTFGAIGGRQSTLRVTDGGGRNCSFSQILTIRPPLPEWREIPPFGRLRIFLADTASRLRELVL